MKNRLMILLCLCMGYFPIITPLIAQDIHFTQYYNSPLNVNPALTGVFQQDMRIMVNWRNQWRSVPVDYRTYSAAFDKKFLEDQLQNGYVGGGIIMNNDRAGDSNLGATQIKLIGSYTRSLNDQTFLTAGFGIGYARRSFDPNNLQWGNQHNGDLLDLSLPTREGDLDAMSDNSFLDISSGLNLNWQNQEGNFWINTGFGLHNINQPKQNFLGLEIAKLPMRTSIYAFAGGKIERWEWLTHAMLQFQGKYQERVVSLGGGYKINEDVSLRLWMATRYAEELDAIAPVFEVIYQNVLAGFSYDINLSGFDPATNGKGGPELSVIYTFTKVEPPKTFKACPIF